MKLAKVEPDLGIDLEHYAVHYIKLSGFSTNPLVSYYYGVWRVIMGRTPAAASDALSCFRFGTNIPFADQQIYTVFDQYNRIIDNIEPSILDRFPEWWIVRKTFEAPLPVELPVPIK